MYCITTESRFLEGSQRVRRTKVPIAWHVQLGRNKTIFSFLKGLSNAQSLFVTHAVQVIYPNDNQGLDDSAYISKSVTLRKASLTSDPAVK